MKDLLSFLVGAFVYYVSFHGSIGVLYDAIEVLTSSQEARNAFIASENFDDIAAFSSFAIPSMITATFLALLNKSWPIWLGISVCSVYTVTLYFVLAGLFFDGVALRVSDYLGPLIVLPITWLCFKLVRKYT
ncbi:hypothetical protein CWB72_19950 [Pseudoalteromonas phenolica]|uniref:hypothetical protein n=1 Tax=Pseudoalteromonas phenolica TaxID=161398 RepID=UPI00110A72F3|nr:hypothetical protein [Pseudoalteromonas phenolica]TMN86354.1 hypothetical protein CWB72_19950 [Pseudoalteromonas phenolica]